MRKKFTMIVAAEAVAFVALLFCALVPCVSGLTPFQAARVRHYLKTNPFHAAAGEERAALSVTAAVGTNGYDRNTFIGSRVQMESEPDYIELNVAFDASGRMVLADSFFDTNEKSIDVDRVVTSLLESTTRSSLLVDLREYTSLNSVSSLLSGSSRFANAAVRGVDENTIGYVRDFFPSTTVLCEYSHKNKLSLAEIKAKGADGICCSASMVSAHFAKKVQQAGLLLWVDCGGSAYRVIKTMRMAKNVDGIVTTKPSLALNMQRSWSYDGFRQQKQK